VNVSIIRRQFETLRTFDNITQAVPWPPDRLWDGESALGATLWQPCNWPTGSRAPLTLMTWIQSVPSIWKIRSPSLIYTIFYRFTYRFPWVDNRILPVELLPLRKRRLHLAAMSWEAPRLAATKMASRRRVAW